MKKIVYTVLCIFFYLSMPLTASAQDENHAAVDKDAARQERRARMGELKQLGREEHHAQRQDVRRRLENLTKDERAALRERRRINSRQGQRPGRGNRAHRGSTTSAVQSQVNDTLGAE